MRGLQGLVSPAYRLRNSSSFLSPSLTLRFHFDCIDLSTEDADKIRAYPYRCAGALLLPARPAPARGRVQ